MEKTQTIVSRSHGFVSATFAYPPQISTTDLPSTVAANAAPSSEPTSKFEANAFLTAANLSSQCPWISTLLTVSVPPLSFFRSSFLFIGHAPIISVLHDAAPISQALC
jgi:hypothetical protein